MDLEAIQLPLEKMETIVDAFSKEMALKDDFRRSIKMLPTFVRELPTGNELGEYYALDLGGTNFRIAKFLFQSPPFLVSKLFDASFTIPDSAKHGQCADDLFDFLAKCICEVVPQKDRTLVLGFTFSFPMTQQSLHQGTLISWTKGWTTQQVEGQEISHLLLRALRKRDSTLQVDIRCVINDTVGTLAAGGAIGAQIGIILGTGTNAAFMDHENQVINSEWGGFSSPTLPRHAVDADIDLDSPKPGEQQFEKLISGHYLGEIFRRMAIQQRCLGENWGNEAFSVDSQFLSRLEEGNANTDVFADKKAEEAAKEIAMAIVERAARLTACAIAAICRSRIPNQVMEVVAAVDGSLFEHHVSFQTRLKAALLELKCSCVLSLVKDGSGLGAALIAATTAAAANSSQSKRIRQGE